MSDEEEEFDDRKNLLVIKHSSNGVFYHARRAEHENSGVLVIDWVKDRKQATAFNFRDAHQIREGAHVFDDSILSIFFDNAD